MNKHKILTYSLLLSITSAFAQTGPVAVPLSPDARETHLQQALQLRKDGNYNSAIEKLDVILTAQSNDAPILMLKGDLQLQGKQYAQAAKTFKILVPLDYENTIAQINLSYALFMDNEASQALLYAESAWQKDSTNTHAIVNYFNAMLWNVKTKAAAAFLKNHTTGLREDQILVMKARLYTASGKYQQGLDHYNTLVSVYPDKHYVREYAEVLLGKREISQALHVLNTSKELYTTIEYNAIEEEIKAAQLQDAGTEFVSFKDVTKNIRTDISAWWQQKEGLKYRIGVRAGISTLTSALQEKTHSQFASITVNEKWNMAWSGRSDITLQNISFSEQSKFTAITGRQSLQYQPTDRLMFGIFYCTDILNYTAALFGKNIRSNTLGYITHIMFDGRNGVYSQGGWTTISDANERLQFFGSLYHLFNTEPLIKTGINFSILHFKNNSITTYFSPDQYLSTELFADYNNTLPGSNRFHLKTQAAVGMQKIEVDDWDPAFRLQIELSYKLKKFESSLKYQTSNVASGSGTGYKFGWFAFGLMAKW